jgi:hypothetical protein
VLPSSRSCIVVTGALVLAALALATLAAGAGSKAFYHSFFINCGPAPTTGIAKELCPRPPATQPLGTIKPGAPGVTVTYITGGGHCSQVVLRIYVDGQKVGETSKLNAGGIGSVAFKVGTGRTHKLGFVEQGFVGGCNSGVLFSVSGKIKVVYTP